jgi:TolA-binding protein
MSTNSQNDALTPAASRLMELARSSLGNLSEEQRVNGARRLRLRLDRARAVPRAAALALVAGGLVIVGLGVWRLKAAGSALALHVDGGKPEPGGLVRAGNAERALRFSDGSEIVLSAASQLHVRSLDEHGARIMLDSGRAHLYVVHAAKTHWELSAGPFSVEVIGTAFAISWDNATQDLELQLENGAVKVNGPVFDGPLSLRAGQWLSVRQSDVRIRAIGAPIPSDSAPEVPGPAASASSTQAAREAPHVLDIAPLTPAQRARAARSRWSSELARGQYENVVQSALKAGLDASLAESSVSELWVLADAARYSRHPDVARGALSAVRQRFPSSTQARAASFFLGRLAEAGQDPRAALSWFGTYLTEAPNGTYASEALGRKMTLVQKLEGAAAARPFAEAYLYRFANGTYAEAARALTQ